MSLLLVLLVFIGITAGLVWFLLSHDHGEREPIKALWLAAGCGLAGGVAAGLLEGWLIPPHDLLPGAAQPIILLAALGVGLIEETCKFLPLALVLFNKSYFNERTDGVIYFALAGLGFGLPENLLYTLQFGAQAGLLRILLTPFFHAAITGMVGYFLAGRKLAGKSLRGIGPVLLAAVVLHGLYDFGLAASSSLFTLGALLITLGMSVGLFVLFLKATQDDQDQGLSAVGHNDFCRSCGFPYPQHHLYCIHCGKNA